MKNLTPRKILLIALTILSVFIIANIAIIIRINQLAHEQSKLKKQINEQNQIIQKYEGSSGQNIDESANIN